MNELEEFFVQFLNIAEIQRDNKGEVFVPEGVCAKEISFEIEEEKLRNLHFVGGCQGNLRAISILLEGMPVEEVIEKVRGITCGNKGTSCTDQLAKFLESSSSVTTL